MFSLVFARKNSYRFLLEQILLDPRSDFKSTDSFFFIQRAKEINRETNESERDRGNKKEINSRKKERQNEKGKRERLLARD